jgi:hypothetical protein
MKSRRVRDRNIRLIWVEVDGSEHLRDFVCVSEAREEVRTEWTDWVIFELGHPHYAGRGRVLDSIDGVSS